MEVSAKLYQTHLIIKCKYMGFGASAVYDNPRSRVSYDNILGFLADVESGRNSVLALGEGQDIAYIIYKATKNKVKFVGGCDGDISHIVKFSVPADLCDIVWSQLKNAESIWRYNLLD